MAKGAIAKENVGKILAQAFGANYVGEYDKKHYVWADENGEKIQVAITLTCPKTPVGSSETIKTSVGLNFEDDNPPSTASTFVAAEITDEEKKNIEEMIKRLDL